MLRKLLQLISAGGVHNLRELAQQLDVSELLLKNMVDDLVCMNYLKPLHAHCRDDCKHCPVTNTCTIGGSGCVWVLTEAGKKVAQVGIS